MRLGVRYSRLTRSYTLFTKSDCASGGVSLATLVKSLCAVVVGTALVSTAFGQDQPQRPQNRQQRSDEPAANARGANEPEQNKENTLPIPAESKSETQHTWSAGGRSVHYTATAGNLLIRDDDNKPNGSIFYVAYTEDGADKSNRPVTFLYNGGPGSATIWLHMGSVGPIRVVTASPEASGPPPFKWVENQYSLLDKTDLVFIDAPLCGFSRAVGKGTAKDFAGVDQDVKAFDKFITRYITVNQRWNSPKYLFGESYGTPRSAALVAALNNDGIQFNGVILLSSVLNYYVNSPGYDLEAVRYLPSYAAIGWYYKKVPQNGSMKDWGQKAREFARGPYADALHQGDMLPKAQFDEIAQKVASFTGLPLDYVKDAKLRISPTRFRKELLRGDEKTLGRYDARFEGDDVDAGGEKPGSYPDNTGINQNWDWHHRPSGTQGFAGGGTRGEETAPDTVIDLSDAMRKNPHLRVFSANGWYDLATPFFGTEHDLGQLMLPEPSRKNVQFGYYPAGHMVYLNVDALKEMHADLERWYGESGH